MFKDFSAKLATVAFTIVLSTTCLLTAVGPAIANEQPAIASAARLMA